MPDKTVLNNGFVYCPKCNSPNIYRWFCGEYSCECGEFFGICEEPKRYTTLQTNCKTDSNNCPEGNEK